MGKTSFKSIVFYKHKNISILYLKQSIKLNTLNRNIILAQIENEINLRTNIITYHYVPIFGGESQNCVQAKYYFIRYYKTLIHSFAIISSIISLKINKICTLRHREVNKRCSKLGSSRILRQGYSYLSPTYVIHALRELYNYLFTCHTRHEESTFSPTEARVNNGFVFVL